MKCKVSDITFMYITFNIFNPKPIFWDINLYQSSSANNFFFKERNVQTWFNCFNCLVLGFSSSKAATVFSIKCNDAAIRHCVNYLGELSQPLKGKMFQMFERRDWINCYLEI